MTQKFKVGDRVNQDFLGDGVITKLTEMDWLVIVKYDITPPIQYNMGENPTAEFESNLTELNVRDDEVKK